MILLPAGNPSGWTGPTGNNTYFLPGNVPTLIDAGVANPGHLDALARALGDAPLALVLITHAHPDHIGGATALRSLWPMADIRQFGAGARPLRAGERIDAGDSSVTVLHTPGHSPDHCCFLHGRDLFCGDLVRLGGTIVIPPSQGGDMAVYIESLRRVRELNPARLLPGHGPVIDDVAGVVDELLRHRLERERQILEVLGQAAWTPEQIVSRVYPGLPRDLLHAAAETVRAHLVKLRSEGRVTEDGGTWTRVS